MSLDDPVSKMSKSAENPLSRISLLDDEAKIRKAIMRATTDSEGSVGYDPENKPGVSNLLNIYSAFSGLPVPEIEKKYKGVGYGAFKGELAAVAVDALAPIKGRYAEIRHSDALVAAMKDGAERAREISVRTMARVKERFGLGIGS
jgi:tryptophanyl-tRNA synthetase